jgi:integrase
MAVRPLRPQLAVSGRCSTTRLATLSSWAFFRQIRWTACSGRHRRSPRHGGPVGSSAYWLVWEQARKLGLPPVRAEPPLVGRPYDLRHAGVSLWLNAGVPATEVARRAGHSVDVLLKIYASCIDGDERTANQPIDDALAA